MSQDFTVNVPAILNDQNVNAINKLMAYHIKSGNGYVSVGSCMQSITNEHLQDMIDALDNEEVMEKTGSGTMGETIFLLGVQLAVAN